MSGLAFPKRVPRNQGAANDVPADDKAIQQTNDDAQTSKLSAVSLGYLHDPYVNLFVSKPSKRPPLINRGSFARSTAIDILIDAFLRAGDDHVGKQIVALGAGFDTRYFLLKNSGVSRLKKYVEIDFPGVVRAKLETIQKHKEIRDLLGEDVQMNLETPELHSAEYHILGGDLRNLTPLQEKLTQLGIDPTLPTLFLSECVLIYMEPADSDKLVQWASQTFSTAAFVTYEMIHPDDPFGRTMLRNLESRSITLRGIQAYPDLPSQVQRYRKLGWEGSSALDMFDIYNHHIPKQELQRVAKLELFDELEEWELISRHYCISWAWQTSEAWKGSLDLSQNIKFVNHH